MNAADKERMRKAVEIIENLARERDEARRVARSVASGWMTYLMTGNLTEPAPDVDTALAYPDPEPTPQEE